MKLPAKEDELKRFLASLPLDKAAALAAAVERERLAGATGMPVDVILEALRPMLRKSRRRIPTPRRLFCVAFEDLLIDGPREEKQTGRILRASVAKLWQWLESEGLKEKLPALESEIAAAILARETKREQGLVAQLRAAAADAVRTSFGQIAPEGPARRALALRFGGEAGLADVEEIALLLDAAHEFDAIRAKLPRQIESLTNEHLAAIRDIYDDLSARRPELCPYVALTLLPRLAKPWEVLRLASVVSRRRDDTLFSETDMGVVGDLLLADMESLTDDLTAAPPHKMNPAVVLPKLERFVLMSNGLIREIGVRKGSKWGQHLVKARHLMSDAMDALIARAAIEINAVLPMQRLGAFAGGAPRRPDLLRDVDGQKLERALKWGELLAGSAKFATDGAFHAAHREAFERVAAHLRQYADAMVQELRTIDDGHRARAEAYVAAAQALGDAVLGPEETDLFRRRVAAATSARA
ncbi:MAG: hypothetical protein GC190_15515 [Alphaproteobacteria bacterium]|nr:hypothetical protein [Alphaproteobacteria bacterium]